jgi:hypothetical protein
MPKAEKTHDTLRHRHRAPLTHDRWWVENRFLLVKPSAVLLRVLQEPEQRRPACIARIPGTGLGSAKLHREGSYAVSLAEMASAIFDEGQILSAREEINRTGHMILSTGITASGIC